MRKSCVLGLDYGPGPQAESGTKDGGCEMDRWENSTHFQSHSDCRSNLEETCNLDMRGHVILVSIYLVLTAVT